jgi:hypothetical protein
LTWAHSAQVGDLELTLRKQMEHLGTSFEEVDASPCSNDVPEWFSWTNSARRTHAARVKRSAGPTSMSCPRSPSPLISTLDIQCLESPNGTVDRQRRPARNKLPPHPSLAQIRRKLEPDPAWPRHFSTEPRIGCRLEF